MGSLTVLYIVVAGLLAVDIWFIILLFSSKAFRVKREKKYLADKRKAIDAIEQQGGALDLHSLGIKSETLFSIYRDITVSVTCTEEVSTRFTGYFQETGIVDRYCNALKSRRRLKRSEAALNLGFLPCDKTRRALEMALFSEKHYYIKVYIINSLVETADDLAIPYIIQSLIGAPDTFNGRIYSILGEYGEKLNDFLVKLKEVDSRELKMVIASFAGYYFSPGLKGMITEYVHSDDLELAKTSAEACLKFYPEYLLYSGLIHSPYPDIKLAAVRAAENIPTQESVDILIDGMSDSGIFNNCVSAVSSIITQSSTLFEYVVGLFIEVKDPVKKDGLGDVLSARIEYLLARLRYDSSERLKKLIVEIVAQGNVSSTIAFLNGNSDAKLEEIIIEILGELLNARADLSNEFRLYLDRDILNRFGLEKLDPQKGEPRREVVRIELLAVFLAVALFVFPSVYFISYYGSFRALGLYGSIKNLFYLFNYFFAYYGISLNSVYLLLLLFSLYGSRRQLRCWKMKNEKFLFKPGILPSISIIAPAYGEEATIIESVSSLLNLSYPDYEVVVVNDGSNDRTLQVLIDHFILERIDMNITERLKTAPIRGLYRNRYLPKLLVVDKVNGGKADSLNAGINMSTKDYFCGIDADSLLERESLLKMTSPFLDTDTDIIATGGNIVPVNGCTVDRGYLTNIKIPQRFLPRLQTMEYIRSFISGRVGWATIHCLLIISGAFGLFRKTSVIESGGYLTGKEKFNKDTVGEDMELVVRLIRHSKGRGENGIVNYVFNANCWTEVPESYGILRRQRDRWQRGLLDIITFHIGMFFNKRYSEVGFIAFPYFIIFEVIGPWIEVQGLLMFVIALALGFLDMHVILLLFIGTIFMGLAVSIISFYIMERGNSYFSGRDIAVMALYAIFENFGVRQFFSVSRLGGYINALRNKQGWGKMTRRGFQAGQGA